MAVIYSISFSFINYSIFLSSSFSFDRLGTVSSLWCDESVGIAFFGVIWDISS